MSQAQGPRPKAQADTAPTTLALIILAAALVLRCWKLADKNIWLDESASWSVVTSSWPEFWRIVVLDIHPPLYYLLLKGWVGLFGAAEIGLRSLSVIAGAATVWLGWQLARRWLSWPVALVVMLWLAISPHLIFYAQEARMYAVAMALVLGASLGYVRWLESNFTRTRELVWFGICAVAALLVHYFTALWLAAIWAHYLAASRFKGAKPWLTAHALIAIAYAPWMPSAIEQLQRGQPWRADVTLARLPWYLSEMFRQFLLGYYGDLRWRLVSGAVVVLVVALAGLMWFCLSRRIRERPGFGFVLSMCLVPVGLGLVALVAKGDMHLSRYVAYVVPFMTIAIAWGWSDLARRPGWAALPVAIGALATVPFTMIYFSDPSRDSDVRPILRYLDGQDASSGRAQPLTVVPGFMAFSVQFYQPGRPLERVSNGEDWSVMEARSLAAPKWILLDYRWPDFERLSADPRFEVMDIPGGLPAKIRLLKRR